MAASGTRSLDPTQVGNVDDAITMLNILVESRSLLIPQESDRILQTLKDRSIAPNFECLYLTIKCWARTKRKGSEERIDELYHQLWQAFVKNDDTNDDRKSKVQTAFLHVLNAYHHASNAHRAEDLLLQFADKFRSGNQTVPPPTLEMCKLVLSTWSRSESSRRANRAEKLVSIMTKDTSLPDPDITCYTLVLNCWASSGKENAPRRAELLLRSMEFNEDSTLRPNLLSYTCVVNAWARSQAPNAPDEAERLFQEIERIKGWKADRVVYTAMISVWGRSQRLESIDKAEKYFERLKKLQGTTEEQSYKQDDRSTDLRVTVVEYTALMQAWAAHVSKNVKESRRAVKRVEELLDELMENYFSSNFGDADAEISRPNRMTFASVFRTISAARRIPNREDRAKVALQKMQELNLEPNAHILALVEKCSRRDRKQMRATELKSS